MRSPGKRRCCNLSLCCVGCLEPDHRLRLAMPRTQVATRRRSDSRSKWQLARGCKPSATLGNPWISEHSQRALRGALCSSQCRAWCCRYWYCVHRSQDAVQAGSTHNYACTNLRNISACASRLRGTRESACTQARQHHCLNSVAAANAAARCHDTNAVRTTKSDLSFVSLPDVADHVGPSTLLQFQFSVRTSKPR